MFSAEYDRLRLLVEEHLESYFKESDAPGLAEAMRYSLLAGGKRVRAVMALTFCGALGGDEPNALDAACAVELIHTYSLIHDDLPAMDNDDFRRGKPSNHKAFGEWRAILAGDALQAAAFEKLARCPLPAERIVKMTAALAAAAGKMCLGQALDMEAGDIIMDVGEISKVHSLKTAALIEASALVGVHAAGGSVKQQIAAAEYARAIGLAFQIRDDVLDATASSEELGKPAGSDAGSGKVTFYSVLGAEKCAELIAEETGRAKRAIDSEFTNAEFFHGLADFLAGRNK